MSCKHGVRKRKSVLVLILLMWPVTMLHELAHIVAAKCLGFHVDWSKTSLRPFEPAHVNYFADDEVTIRNACVTIAPVAMWLCMLCGFAIALMCFPSVVLPRADACGGSVLATLRAVACWYVAIGGLVDLLANACRGPDTHQDMNDLRRFACILREMRMKKHRGPARPTRLPSRREVLKREWDATEAGRGRHDERPQ